MFYQKTVRLSMYLALSILLSILESLIPIVGGMIPGIKLGLANIILIIVLYQYGLKEAIGISILRVILVGILRTGIFSTTFFFSLFGTICSVIGMSIFMSTKLSIIGVSIIGAICHSIGQIGVAIILLHIPNLIYYLPWMLFGSIITGTMIGYFSLYLFNQLKML